MGIERRLHPRAIGSEEETTIEVRALIVRSTKVASPDSTRPHLYGLHFLDLHDESFKLVERYVWDQLHDSLPLRPRSV
jgi:hypothetical protein